MDGWALAGFPDGRYNLRACGPNGFLRAFTGSKADPALRVSCDYQSSDIVIRVANQDSKNAVTARVRDASYGGPVRSFRIPAGAERTLTVKLARSQRWYDVEVTFDGVEGYSRRYAGRVENGEEGISDPAMA